MNWIVSELFYPDEVSTANILTEIALKRVKRDKKVNVICGPFGYEKSYFIQKKDLNTGIKIFRVNLIGLNKNKLLQRFLRLILLTFKMSWLILFKVKKNDNVFITTNPAVLVITTSILKKVIGFNIELLVHDVFPENLVPAGLIKMNSLKYIFLLKIFNNSYRNMNRIVVLGEDMRLLLHQKLNSKNVKIDVIPNWADDDIYPLPDFNISDYLGIDVRSKIVIGFAGNLGRLQGVLKFVSLFSMCENENIVLVIFGDGAMGSALKEKLINENISNVYYFGPKPRNHQIYFLNACHIGLITMIHGMKGLGVPSKTYNLMAAGKPLLYIGDQHSEVDRYVKYYDCGWSFSWVDSAELSQFLNNLSLETLPEILCKGLKSKDASENFKKDICLNLF